ncbi:hypothetical protein M6B38_309140 [Iris pallida]|uniref:Uncharacterized protein n=1 Tax=Iris pallida TaxID=29817 RepID=A0AAX6HIS5_IRIPA|nr:hypothetical protein M6B38_309140 [Iris pallida]
MSRSGVGTCREVRRTVLDTICRCLYHLVKIGASQVNLRISYNLLWARARDLSWTGWSCDSGLRSCRDLV